MYLYFVSNKFLFKPTDVALSIVGLKPSKKGEREDQRRREKQTALHQYDNIIPLSPYH